LKTVQTRLPLYYRLSERLLRDGEVTVALRELSSAVGVEIDQLLQDFVVLGLDPGKEGKITIAQLHDVAEHLLGLRPVSTAVVIGMGRLGSAIASYEGFGPFGMRIVAVFDHDPEKIGQFVSGHRILPMEQLEDVLGIFQIRLAVLTLAPESAQEVTNRLVQEGVQAIWNFAPVELEVPDDVVVRSEDLAAGLATLCGDLRKANRKRLLPEKEE
jgi:redox-sensing transcriptional repressor